MCMTDKTLHLYTVDMLDHLCFFFFVSVLLFYLLDTPPITSTSVPILRTNETMSEYRSLRTRYEKYSKIPL